MAIGILQIGVRKGDEFAIRQNNVAIGQNVAGFAPVAPAVHLGHSADRSGDADEEGKPVDPGLRRPPRHHADRGRRARFQGRLAGDFDIGERLAQLDHHSRHAAIADDHVRSHAQRHHRHLAVEPFEKAFQVFDIGGFEQPVGLAARLEPHVLCQRCLPRQPSAHAFDRDRRSRRPFDRAGGGGTIIEIVPVVWLRHACHAPPCDSIAGARVAAHLVISPAPRHTTISPGASSCASVAARSA